MLLFVELHDELFVIVGGNAFWIITYYIDHLFGLNFYDRIVSLNDDEAISTKSRGLTGKRAGLSEQFRDDYKMINYLQFGKIPKELHVKLSDKISLLHFPHLLSSINESLKIVAGKSFKISKEVDFESLHQTIIELAEILTLAPKEEISSYINIQDAALIKELNDQLLEKIYNNIPYVLEQNNDLRDYFEFDFCNPNKIEAFYNAESYKLFERAAVDKKRDGLFSTLNDKKLINKTVLTRAYELHKDNKQALLHYLYGVNVSCYIGSTRKANSGFIYHINTEIKYQNTAYFLIDSKWYKLKQTFIDALSSQTEAVLKSSKLGGNILDKKWDFKDSKFVKESTYNNLYEGIDDYIVIDTIISDGIELCDILHISQNDIYLIHVKHSFTARVRELTNQILISARRLSEAISSKNNSFFNSIYDKLLLKNRSTNKLSKEEFYQLFQDKNPVYVLATASHLVNDISIIDNIQEYDSNIARFSLITCAAEMRTNYYDLKTFQIERNKI